MSTDDTRSVSPQVLSRSTVSRRQLLASPLLMLLGRMLGIRPALAQSRESLAGSQLAKMAGSKRTLQAEIDTFDVSFLPAADLTFALVADTHTDKQETSSPVTRMCFNDQLLGARARDDLNDPRTAKVYTQLNANPPAFMIHLGDLVHGFPGEQWWPIQVKKANGLLRRLEIPSYLVPGNHDIGNKLSTPIPGQRWPGSTDNPRDVYYVSPRNIEIFERDFGPSFFHFESSGNLFLVVNAYAFNTGFETEERQWRWLEETLATSGDFDNVFLAMHPLPYWVRTDEPGEKKNYEVVDEPARSRLLALCAEHDVRAIFTGHIHHDYVRYHGSMLIAGSPSTSFSRDNWGLYFPLAAPTWDTGRAGYCQVRVRGRGIVRQLIRTVDLLPAVPMCQEENPFPPRRLMARQTGDGVHGIVAVTVPLIRQHPGLSAPSNAIVRRHQGADDVDERWVAWVSGRSGQGEEWLKIRLAAPCQISRVVIHPGRHWRSKFEIQLRSGDGPWTLVARGESASAQGEGTAPPIEYQVGGRSATVLRVLFTGTKNRSSVRGVEIYNQDEVDVTALPGFATATASSVEREAGMVNTAAFSQGFDLNPSYIRLDPRTTSFQAISPAPGLFNVDPWLVESTRHAKREGARIWGVISAAGEGVGRRAADLKEFSGYCQALARILEGIDVWEIDGDRRQGEAAMSAIGQLAANARFAVSEKLGAPPADFAVSHADHIPTESRRPTLLVRPPFPSRRQPGLGARLAHWLVTCLDPKRSVPCVSLLPGEGLLDGWDDPMTAFYVVRAFNTVLAGAVPSPDHSQADAALSTVHLASPNGRFIVVLRAPGSFGSVTIQLRKDATEAWWIDPLTSTSRQLVLEGRELRDLRVPSHPVILRLV